MESATFSVELSATVEGVWEALTREADRWWPKNMLVLGASARPAVEPHIGGRVYEYRSDGAGLLLATVVEILPHEALVLQSVVGARETHAALIAIRLSTGSVGRTKLTVNVAGEKTGEWWRRLLTSGLQPYVESPRPV